RTLLWIKRPRGVLVEQDAVGRPFEVVELPGPKRPPERRADRVHQHHRKRHEQVEAFHAVPYRASNATGAGSGGASCRPCSRSAFATTASEEAAMPAPAASGVIHPATACGMASA